MAALNIKNLPTGAGDDFKIDASYAKGDTKNVISTAATSPNFAMFGGSNKAYQSIGFGQTSDAVYLPAGLAAGGGGLAGLGGTGNIKLVESYGVRGAFNHNWDPYWSSSLFGGFGAVRYGGSAGAGVGQFGGDITSGKGAWCASYIFANKLTVANTSANFSCNPDFNVAMVGVVTRWTPVKNLTFSAEVMYTRLDQNFTGASVLTPSRQSRPRSTNTRTRTL
jgi:hypothetical protein